MGRFSNDTINYTYDELGRVLTPAAERHRHRDHLRHARPISQLEFPIGDVRLHLRRSDRPRARR